MILLTGYKGFIGQNLHKRCKSSLLYLSEIESCFKDLEVIPWEQVHEVWHLGAISDTTETNISKIYKYNIEYTIRLFEEAIERRVPVKYASSASVYGNIGGHINPLNYYSLSKATIDMWVQDNMHRFSKINGYRFFNVYGRYEDHKGSQASPLHTFTKQAIETGTIKLFEKSWQYERDFVCVDDVVDCWLTHKPSGIYDVGTSVPVSFQQVAELVADKYGAKIEYVKFPDHLKDKYQYYTRARKDFDIDFKSVSEYLRDA